MNKRHVTSFIAAFAALTVMLVSSCSEKQPAISLLSCSVDSVDFAFVNPHGEVLPYGVKSGMPSAVVNGYFTATDGAGVSVYKYNKENPEPVKGLSGLKSAGFMAYGVIPVCRQGGHIEIANGKGESVAALVISDGEITECVPGFVDGVLVVTTDKGLQGLVDTHGQIVVKPEYTSIGPIRNGRFIAMTDVPAGNIINQKFSVVRTDGRTVFVFPDDVVPVNQNIINGKTVVRTASGFGICDITDGGSVKELPSSIKAVTDFDDGKIAYRDANGRSGLISVDGQEILQPKFRRIRIGSKGIVAVCDEAGWAIIDNDGNRKEMPGVTMLSPVPEQAVDAGFAFIGQKDGGYFVINSKGEIMNEEPLMRINYNSLTSAAKITSGYPVATTPVELPLDDGFDSL